MTPVFGQDFAAAYDLMYAGKDYQGECDVLEAIFQGSDRSVHTILDLGCGTGGHAVRLAQRGYSVVGVDQSVDMLKVGRERVAANGFPDVKLLAGDIRSMRLGRRFDAVICMFAVLGYQISDRDVLDTLGTVRQHLVPGGLFVFDVWYGPAVEATGPEPRVKVIPTALGEVERHASATLDRAARVCTVTYRLITRQGGRPDQTANEVHHMRYFSRDELDSLITQAGMALGDLTAFPDLGAPPSIETWNVLVTVQG